MKQKLFLFLSFLAFFNVFAQGTTGSIIVTINDSSSTPISGVSITLYDPAGGAVGSAVTTNASGQATFSNLASVGVYTYTATKTCYVSLVSQSITYNGVNDAPVVGTMVSVSTLSNGVTKTGNVLTANETNVGASYAWSFNNVAITGTAGTKRVYTAYVPGNYVLNVGCTSTPNTSSVVTISSADSPISMTFTVKDVDTQAVISGTSLTLTDSNFTQYKTTTDANGNAVYLGLPTGSYNYSITNSCYASVLAQPLTYDGQNALTTNVAMKSASHLDNGVTQAGNVLTATESTPNVTYAWYLGSSTTAVGSKKVYTATVPGDYTLKVTAGASCAIVTSSVYHVLVSDAPNLTITLKNSANTVIANQSVNLMSGTTTVASSTTDVNGIAVFIGIPVGSYTVTAPTCYVSASSAIAYDGQTDPHATIQMLGTTDFIATYTADLNGYLFTANETKSQAVFQWYSKIGTATTFTKITGATSKTYTANVPGTYHFTVGPNTTATCLNTSADIIVDYTKIADNLNINVVDSNSTAISGATVKLTAGTTTIGTQTTDANGDVFFVGLTNGAAYTYTISKTCYNTTTAQHTYVGGAGSDFVPFTLPSQTFKTTVTSAVISAFTISNTGVKLTADENATGVKYQWTVLNSGTYQNISGATSQSYTANTAGSYKVNLSTTAACVNVTPVTSVVVNVNATDIPHNVTFMITDGVNPVHNATLFVYANNATTAIFSKSFTGSSSVAIGSLPAGNYTYKLVQQCYNDVVGQSFTVGGVPMIQTCTFAGAGASLISNLTAVVYTSNGIGGGASAADGFSINIKNATGNTNTYDVTKASSSLGTLYFNNLAYGDYDYTVTKNCYITKKGTITIGCNDGLPYDFREYGVIETANDIDKTVTQQGNVLIANATGNYTYQWVDSNNVSIPNATSATYTAMAAGSYAVNVTNACSVTATSVPMTVSADVIPYNLTITATDGTNPVSGVMVTLNSVSKATDITGKVTYTGLLNGTYSYTATNTCYNDFTSQSIIINNSDATDTAMLTNNIDRTVTQAGNVLTANATGTQYVYQWLDCDNANAPIANATTQSYTATANGSYAVKITNTTCSTNVTSDCVLVTTLGLEQNAVSVFTVYPNPVTDNLVLQMNNDFQNVTVEVINMQGQVVGKSVYNGGSNYKIDMSGLASGLYILNVTADKMHATQRVMKK